MYISGICIYRYIYLYTFGPQKTHEIHEGCKPIKIWVNNNPLKIKEFFGSHGAANWIKLDVMLPPHTQNQVWICCFAWLLDSQNKSPNVINFSDHKTAHQFGSPKLNFDQIASRINTKQRNTQLIRHHLQVNQISYQLRAFEMFSHFQDYMGAS